jgi:hypothetical protein
VLLARCTAPNPSRCKLRPGEQIPETDGVITDTGPNAFDRASGCTRRTADGGDPPPIAGTVSVRFHEVDRVPFQERVRVAGEWVGAEGEVGGGLAGAEGVGLGELLSGRIVGVQFSGAPAGGVRLSYSCVLP